jgi:hypothetical protein
MTVETSDDRKKKLFDLVRTTCKEITQLIYSKNEPISFNKLIIASLILDYYINAQDSADDFTQKQLILLDVNQHLTKIIVEGYNTANKFIQEEAGIPLKESRPLKEEIEAVFYEIGAVINTRAVSAELLEGVIKRMIRTYYLHVGLRQDGFEKNRDGLLDVRASFAKAVQEGFDECVSIME